LSFIDLIGGLSLAPRRRLAPVEHEDRYPAPHEE
jgi:hypothetical protein